MGWACGPEGLVLFGLFLGNRWEGLFLGRLWGWRGLSGQPAFCRDSCPVRDALCHLRVRGCRAGWAGYSQTGRQRGEAERGSWGRWGLGLV